MLFSSRRTHQQLFFSSGQLIQSEETFGPRVYILEILVTGTSSAVGLAVGVPVAKGVVSAIGFKAGGILAGSKAATLMSMAGNSCSKYISFQNRIRISIMR